MAPSSLPGYAPATTSMPIHYTIRTELLHSSLLRINVARCTTPKLLGGPNLRPRTDVVQAIYHLHHGANIHYSTNEQDVLDLMNVPDLLTLNSLVILT